MEVDSILAIGDTNLPGILNLIISYISIVINRMGR